ncbi:hypothetical protein BGX31_009014 [Mortierella sp. GBA43]|nr:hypothetical protein BGX31_009014 [Mortierella sp. GBA43]
MAKDFNSDLGNSVSSEWIQRVLESCSSLEQITAAIIHSHDIINGKPWSCLRLKIFKIMVNMEFEARPLVHGRARSRFTEADEKQCREVFWQLSQLKALKVLNMECYLPSLSAMKFPLPLELRVGLEQLNRLKHLEAIGYYGTQDIRMRTTVPVTPIGFSAAVKGIGRQ